MHKKKYKIYIQIYTIGIRCCIKIYIQEKSFTTLGADFFSDFYYFLLTSVTFFSARKLR